MPELPDIELYLSCLAPRVLHEPLAAIRVRSPFLVRTHDPPIEALEGRRVTGLRRLGKRIVLSLDGDLHLVLHLMIAGRLLWKPPGAKSGGKTTLALFEFPTGTLVLTEAGGKHRASLHVVAGEGGLAAHDPGGLEPLDATLNAFRNALRRENRTLKRVLTDPRTFAGIGNAYSDEILHAARLSPLAQTQRLADDEVARLYAATQATLRDWTQRLRERFATRFPGPGDVTAFRPEFAVHGRYGQPCPACGTAVQRIRYADNETNYCARCQTGGRVLADRSLSRLLKGDWPGSIDDAAAT